MFIKDYISKDYPVFSLKDSIEEASNLAKDFGFSHVFVKSKGVLLGAISLSILEENPDGDLQTLSHHLDKFAIIEDANLLDSIRLFHVFNANIVPVINHTEKYMGYISAEDIFAEFSKYPMFSEAGAILTVQTTNKHYSMVEVSKIVESNNAKIYSCFISAVNEENIELTLKISQTNLTSINETFERFGYQVLFKYYNDQKEDLLKDRFGFFQKYLEF